MNMYAIALVLVGFLIMAASAPISQSKGAGKAGNVLLSGLAVTAVGLVWIFGIG